MLLETGWRGLLASDAWCLVVEGGIAVCCSPAADTLAVLRVHCRQLVSGSDGDSLAVRAGTLLACSPADCMLAVSGSAGTLLACLALGNTLLLCAGLAGTCLDSAGSLLARAEVAGMAQLGTCGAAAVAARSPVGCMQEHKNSGTAGCDLSLAECYC